MTLHAFFMCYTIPQAKLGRIGDYSTYSTLNLLITMITIISNWFPCQLVNVCSSLLLIVLRIIQERYVMVLPASSLWQLKGKLLVVIEKTDSVRLFFFSKLFSWKHWYRDNFSWNSITIAETWISPLSVVGYLFCLLGTFVCPSCWWLSSIGFRVLTIDVGFSYRCLLWFLVSRVGCWLSWQLSLTY